MSGGGRAGVIQSGVKYWNLSDTYIQSPDGQSDRVCLDSLLLPPLPTNMQPDSIFNMFIYWN